MFIAVEFALYTFYKITKINPHSYSYEGGNILLLSMISCRRIKKYSILNFV